MDVPCVKRAARPLALSLPVLGNGRGCADASAAGGGCRDCAPPDAGKAQAEDVRRWSELLKGLGHPLRLRIVEALVADTSSVTALAQRLRLPQAIVSQQLGILRRRRLVHSRRRGAFAYYRVGLPGLRRLLRWLSCNAPR